MKRNIFFRTYSIPLLLLAVLIFTLFRYDAKPFNKFLSVALLIAVTLRILLTNYRYLNRINADNEQLTMTYTNHFFTTKTIAIHISDIDHVELTQNPISIYSPVLVLRTPEELYTFHILSDNMFVEVKDILQTTNLQEWVKSKKVVYRGKSNLQ